MKILFINYEFPPLGGGGGTTSKYLAKALVEQGQEVKVLTAGFKNLSQKEVVDGYEIIRVKCKRKIESQCSQREMFSFVFNAIRPMLEIIDNWKPDIVHIFFALPTGPLGYIAKKFRNVPYIIYLLGADVPGFLANEMDWEHKLLNGVSQQIWSKANGVVANSYGLAKLGNKTFSDIPIKVITNGINLNDFNKARNNKIDGKLNLLFIGRLVPQKGLLTLLKSIDILVNKKAQKNIKLKVIGEGSERKIAEQYIINKKIKGNIEFLGWVKLEELNNFYNSVDIFVLPSTFEGMPSVVLQAMACGLPVVSTKVFGSEDLIKDGQNGYLVDIGDFNMIAEKIYYLFNNKNRIIQMGDESLRIVQEYNWENIAKKFIDYYKNSIK